MRLSFVAVCGLCAMGLIPIVGLWIQADGIAGVLDARRLALLARSGWIAAMAACIALAVGGGAGVIAARIVRSGRVWIAAGLALLCVSPYVWGLAWIGGGLDAAGSGGWLGSPSAVAWVLGAAHAPLVAIWVGLAAQTQEPAAEEAALLAGGLPGALRTLGRGLGGAFGTAGLIVFVLCLSDHAVASLLQVPTYPVEVFLGYAGAFRPDEAARAVLPLLGVGTVLALGLAGVLPGVLSRRSTPGRASRWPLAAGQRPIALVLLGAVLIALAGTPLTKLLASLPEIGVFPRVLSGGAPAMGRSLAVAGAAAWAALLLAWPASAHLARVSSRALMGWAVLLLLPICVPASAYAIAWTEVVSMSPGGARALSDLGVLGPALCLTARFGGPLALGLSAARRRVPIENHEAACLQEPRSTGRELWITGPPLIPVILGGAFVVAALSLNQVGVLVITVPPGFEVLPLRVDNLLHYGLPDEAVLLALVTATTAALLAAGAMGLHRLLSVRV